jgi:hypothetical protein
MVETFLNSMFQIVYEGLHKGESRRVQTVMLAYDDAIHGVTGKAGDDRIFELDFNPEPWHRLFSKSDTFLIRRGEYPATADYIINRAQEMGYHIQWREPSEQAEAGEGIPEIVLCENIFQVEDLSLQKIYIDINDCILQTEDDVLDVINYNYSRRSFLFAQKPVFLRKIAESHF